MTTKAGVGMSRHHNPNVAGREAAEQALKKARVSKPNLVFMFGSIGYDQYSLVRAARESTGGAPLTGCSGKTVRHRLNIRGDRDANRALYVIALGRMGRDERTKAYVAKRQAEGKSKREIIRCLKRYIARELYRILLQSKSPLPSVSAP